ncbi:MAG TPA: hypothetical protein VM681_06120 [Candidatus Thermoplasmatota archaeon]|nr:hypothetical protein [Candidatus Thermoplasmatota archaeon]
MYNEEKGAWVSEYEIQTQRLHLARAALSRLVGGYVLLVVAFFAALLLLGTNLFASVFTLGNVFGTAPASFAPNTLGDLTISRMAGAAVLWMFAAAGLLVIGTGLDRDRHVHRLERQADALRRRVVAANSDHVPWLNAGRWTAGAHPWLYASALLVGVLLATSVLLLLDKPVFRGLEIRDGGYFALVVNVLLLASAAATWWVHTRLASERTPPAVTAVPAGTVSSAAPE